MLTYRRFWRLIHAVTRRWRSTEVKSCAVEPLADQPFDRRLARLARWCVDGRLAAAELELYAWQRDPDCPAQARVLLAALTARRDPDHTSDLLHPDIDLDHVEQGNPSVEQLAAALADSPQLIESLVAAQKIEPDQEAVALLRQAVAMVVEDESHRAVGCQALAELALLADDPDDARRWAHRGLEVNPRSAALAMILGQLRDDPRDGPPAAVVLDDAHQAHPDYPDLRAALIRREFADGHTDQAHIRLRQWLSDEPEHPIAHRVHGELAA